MKVKTLYIYPVKSLAGIEVSRFELDDFGPQGDRRWMIIDSDNRFVTQRRLPQLANVSTALQNGVVVIDVPGEGVFPLEAGTDAVEVTVWRDQVVATAGAGRAFADGAAPCWHGRRPERHV